jgi:predicted metal-dependent HD superfamily phosphohydrolase
MLAAGLPRESAECVHALILKTCHDAQADTRDEALLIDIDLAILGADTPRLDLCECPVRAEYDWVSDFLFNRT